ncbi:hypothetical protein SO802_017729 [Lithocarpus litseifolius]|uniref:Uncharacterized protein n=1 Tax=Lithocarpus litseifolius TaxID=425828 RepID=A0AAW2CKG2_9ROSI
MKEEEGRCIAAVEAFNVADKRINELRNKLTKAERDKKSAEAVLNCAERQVEAEKARDQAEQEGYDVGVAETEEALKAEVSGESIECILPSCYPCTRLSQFQIDTSSEVAEFGKGGPAKVPPSSDSPSKEAQQHGVAEKEANANKGVPLDATKPPAIPQDRLKEKEVPFTMETVLATLPVPAKGDLKSKDSGSSETTLSQSTKAPPKEKIVIKKK